MPATGDRVPCVYVENHRVIGLDSADPIRVMILDGESAGTYHKWQIVTPVLKKQLDETGLFQVDVVTAPPAGGDFSAFKPDFSRHKNAAPFKRNDQMLGVMPIGVIVFPGTGIQANLADKAMRLGITVWRFGAGA